MTPAAWILTSWLCVGPGVTGECAPQRDEIYPTRGTCLAAARMAKIGLPELHTNCRRDRSNDG
jgi:hypothetical protein